MKYQYINMPSNNSRSIVVKGKGKSNRPGLYTIHKLEVANLHSSSITVDVYIERIDIADTEKLYGAKENGNVSLESNITEYANKTSDIFYKIKGAVVPAGVTLSLFTEHPCKHSDEFDLVVAVAESASVDIAVDWEYTTERSGSNNINTSDY